MFLIKAIFWILLLPLRLIASLLMFIFGAIARMALFVTICLFVAQHSGDKIVSLAEAQIQSAGIAIEREVGTFIKELPSKLIDAHQQF